jgi:hypothetical protein
LALVIGLFGNAGVASAQDLGADQRAVVVDTLIKTAEMKGEERRRFLAAEAAASADPTVSAALIRAHSAASDSASLDEVVRAALTAPAPGAAAPVVAPPAAAPSATPPLAVPVGVPMPPPPGVSMPQLAIPGSTVMRPPDMAAIRDYQARSLRMGTETELHGGGATYIGGWGGRRWSYGVVVPNPVYTTRTWAVYQGAERLEVPEFFRAVGDVDRATELETTIGRQKSVATALYTVGVGGLAASIAGWYGSRYSATPAQRQQWMLAGLGGTCAAFVGFVGGSIPSSRLRHSKYDFPYVIDHDAAQREVDAHNERVRRELGLSPQDVMQAEGAR